MLSLRWYDCVKYAQRHVRLKVLIGSFHSLCVFWGFNLQTGIATSAAEAAARGLPRQPVRHQPEHLSTNAACLRHFSHAYININSTSYCAHHCGVIGHRCALRVSATRPVNPDRTQLLCKRDKPVILIMFHSYCVPMAPQRLMNRTAGSSSSSRGASKQPLPSRGWRCAAASPTNETSDKVGQGCTL